MIPMRFTLRKRESDGSQHLVVECWTPLELPDGPDPAYIWTVQTFELSDDGVAVGVVGGVAGKKTLDTPIEPMIG